jgi:3-oxoadipyl-CoA thiolase
MSAAYICDFTRTPFGRVGGVLAHIRTDDLAAIPLGVLAGRNPDLDPEAIDEVVLGCANQAGEDNRNVARMALLLAGFPASVPGVTVNRLCASGLEAVGYAARMIRAGEGDLVIAGGVESMSRAPFVMAKAETAFSRHAEIFDTTIGWRFVNPRLQKRYGIDSMPETAENVAREWDISRADQDAFALRSQSRAVKSRGFLAGEITPVESPSRKGASVIIDADEHPRSDTTLEALARLKPIVCADGTVTAGNSSGVNDGAAALLVASEAALARYKLSPRARILGYATAGVAPWIMGMGPVPATHRLLARTGLSVSDFAVVELNEAFAAQALAVLRDLGLPDDAEHVNSHGGAIALGHPLGASGARLALTAVRALEEAKGKLALVTLCIGVGQGAAMILERV